MQNADNLKSRDAWDKILGENAMRKSLLTKITFLQKRLSLTKAIVMRSDGK